MEYQKLLFPQKYVNVTQGSYGAFSHSEKPAIDSAGGNSQANNVYSCGNGKIGFIDYVHKSRVYVHYQNVISPKGEKKDRLTGYFYHNIPMSDFVEGDNLKAKEYFMNEGEYSEPGGASYGFHLHFELLNTEGRTSPRDSVKPEEWLFLERGYHIFVQNKSKYHFYWLADNRKIYADQLKINRAKVQIRKSTDKYSTLLGFAEIGYFDILETKEVNGIKWCKVYKNMWIEANNGCEIVYKETSQPKPQPQLIEFGLTKDNKKIYIEK